MLCKLCHKHFSDGQSFCPYCGHSVAPDSQKAAMPFLWENDKAGLSVEKKLELKAEVQLEKVLDRQPGKLEKLKQKIAGIFGIEASPAVPGFMPTGEESAAAKEDSRGEGEQRNAKYRESERLRSFKKEMKTKEMFRPFQGYVSQGRQEARLQVPTILVLRNKTRYPYMVRITGVGNVYYNQFVLKWMRSVTVKLESSTYSIESGVMEGNVFHNRNIAKNEEWVHKKSPFNSRYQSDYRLVSFTGGKYELFLGYRYF